MIDTRTQIIPPDDGLYDVVCANITAGPFPTIAFALQIDSGEKPAPAPVAKFRRYLVFREVRDASVQ